MSIKEEEKKKAWGCGLTHFVTLSNEEVYRTYYKEWTD